MNPLIYAIAVHLLNALLMNERGPFGVIEKSRNFLKKNEEAKAAFGCHFCFSGYTSMMVVALGVLGGDAPRKAPVLWLATWGATMLIYWLQQLPSELFVMAVNVKDRPQTVLFTKNHKK